MRIFKTRAFHKWAQKALVSDEALRKAVDEMLNGLVEVDLGGGVVKKRVALQGRGKSGGARTVVAFKAGKNVFFLYGFSKNERANINEKELRTFKRFATEFFEYDTDRLKGPLKSGALVEVKK